MSVEPPQVEIARQSLDGGYIIVALNTMWVWDLIISIPEDVQVFTGRRLRSYDLIYVVARITTIGFLTASIGFLPNSGSNCENVHITATWFQPIAAVSNSSLFLIRALAVFAESSWKNKAGFVLVWSTVFLTFAFPFGSKVNSVPSCTVKDIGLLGSLGFLGIVVFDTLVVVTISFKLLHLNQEHRDSGETWIASLVRGKGLGHISKVLLYSGQLYYLTTVGLTAFAAVMFFPINSSFPPTVRAGFSSASWAIQNIMVCKVFRLLRLGAIQDDMTTRQLPSIRFATGDSTALADTETFALDEIGAQSTII